MISLIDKFWYKKNPLRWFLWPLSIIYLGVVTVRRFMIRSHQVNIPIIVVGNLTVGGTGKTPLVIALAQALTDRGIRVGIVSRGYGAHIQKYPYEVNSNDKAHDVGDEPLLLARKTNVPVVIAPRRVDAVQYLITRHQSQIIISDDGLQHYAMGRDIEIVVIDGVRGFGNGLCLPAGPLRERIGRLKQADFLIINGKIGFDNSLLKNYPKSYHMELIPGKLTQLRSGKACSWSDLATPIAAIAAIGYPQRFFSLLKNLGIVFKPYPFADHYAFQPEDLSFSEKNIVMTEKDAVKCSSFATDTMYYLPVEAQIEDKFFDALWQHKQLQGYI